MTWAALEVFSVEEMMIGKLKFVECIYHFDFIVKSADRLASVAARSASASIRLFANANVSRIEGGIYSIIRLYRSASCGDMGGDRRSNPPIC